MYVYQWRMAQTNGTTELVECQTVDYSLLGSNQQVFPSHCPLPCMAYGADKYLKTVKVLSVELSLQRSSVLKFPFEAYISVISIQPHNHCVTMKWLHYTKTNLKFTREASEVSRLKYGDLTVIFVVTSEVHLHRIYRAKGIVGLRALFINWILQPITRHLSENWLTFLL